MPRRIDQMDDDARERQQAEDRAALQSGRLPASAVNRLQQQANSADKCFSSDLSTREFLLLQNSQVRPLGQVMGTAFITVLNDQQVINSLSGSAPSPYSVTSDLDRERSTRGIIRSNSNLNSNYSYYQSYGQQPVTGELTDLTMSRLEARRSALSRMEMEAELLGASGVIGVRVVTKVHDWTVKTIEYTVFGTAIHIPSYTEERPFMSLLDGQEFWQLWTAGYEPRGIALGVCSYTDCTDYGTIHGRNYNQEIAAYTQSFYEAREIAMRRFVASLKRMKARGAVGMKIDYDFEEGESEVEVSEGTSVKYLHLVTHLVVMGTAIARRQMTASDQPRGRTMLIYDLKKPGSASVEFTARRKGQEAGSDDHAKE